MAPKMVNKQRAQRKKRSCDTGMPTASDVEVDFERAVVTVGF